MAEQTFDSVMNTRKSVQNKSSAQTGHRNGGGGRTIWVTSGTNVVPKSGMGPNAVSKQRSTAQVGNKSRSETERVLRPTPLETRTVEEIARDNRIAAAKSAVEDVEVFMHGVRIKPSKMLNGSKTKEIIGKGVKTRKRSKYDDKVIDSDILTLEDTRKNNNNNDDTIEEDMEGGLVFYRGREGVSLYTEFSYDPSYFSTSRDGRSMNKLFPKARERLVWSVMNKIHTPFKSSYRVSGYGDVRWKRLRNRPVDCAQYVLEVFGKTYSPWELKEKLTIEDVLIYCPSGYHIWCRTGRYEYTCYATKRNLDINDITHTKALVIEKTDANTSHVYIGEKPLLTLAPTFIHSDDNVLVLENLTPGVDPSRVGLANPNCESDDFLQFFGIRGVEANPIMTELRAFRRLILTTPESGNDNDYFTRDSLRQHIPISTEKWQLDLSVQWARLFMCLQPNTEVTSDGALRMLIWKTLTFSVPSPIFFELPRGFKIGDQEIRTSHKIDYVNSKHVLTRVDLRALTIPENMMELYESIEEEVKVTMMALGWCRLPNQLGYPILNPYSAGWYIVLSGWLDGLYDVRNFNGFVPPYRASHIGSRNGPLFVAGGRSSRVHTATDEHDLMYLTDGAGPIIVGRYSSPYQWRIDASDWHHDNGNLPWAWNENLNIPLGAPGVNLQSIRPNTNMGFSNPAQFLRDARNYLQNRVNGMMGNNDNAHNANSGIVINEIVNDPNVPGGNPPNGPPNQPPPNPPQPPIPPIDPVEEVEDMSNLLSQAQNFFSNHTSRAVNQIKDYLLTILGRAETKLTEWRTNSSATGKRIYSMMRKIVRSVRAVISGDGDVTEHLVGVFSTFMKFFMDPNRATLNAVEAYQGCDLCLAHVETRSYGDMRFCSTCVTVPMFNNRGVCSSCTLELLRLPHENQCWACMSNNNRNTWTEAIERTRSHELRRSLHDVMRSGLPPPPNPPPVAPQQDQVAPVENVVAVLDIPPPERLPPPVPNESVDDLDIETLLRESDLIGDDSDADDVANWLVEAPDLAGVLNNGMPEETFDLPVPPIIQVPKDPLEPNPVDMEELRRQRNQHYSRLLNTASDSLPVVRSVFDIPPPKGATTNVSNGTESNNNNSQSETPSIEEILENVSRKKSSGSEDPYIVRPVFSGVPISNVNPVSGPPLMIPNHCMSNVVVPGFTPWIRQAWDYRSDQAENHGLWYRFKASLRDAVTQIDPAWDIQLKDEKSSMFWCYKVISDRYVNRVNDVRPITLQTISRGRAVLHFRTVEILYGWGWHGAQFEASSIKGIRIKKLEYSLSGIEALASSQGKICRPNSHSDVDWAVSINNSNCMNKLNLTSEEVLNTKEFFLISQCERLQHSSLNNISNSNRANSN